MIYGDEQVCGFALTATLSDNPLITVLLRARRKATLRVTRVNTRGERFETSHPIRLT